MGEILWEEHQELIAREEDGESVDIEPDGAVIIKRWTRFQDPEEAISHHEITPLRTPQQLLLPYES